MKTLLLAPARLPSTLYRIDYTDAQTTFDPAKGFVASDPRAPPLAELNYLRLAFLSHASWGRVPSPFISTFADERHARNWALAQGDVSVRMMVIDTTRLPTGQVLRAVDGYQKLGIEVPANARTEHEYLCLNRIPATAVVEVIGHGELENARELGELSNVRRSACGAPAALVEHRS